MRSLLELRQQNVVVQRWDSSCGAAALATLLTYQHGVPVSEKTVAQAMLGRVDPLLVKVRGGFSLLDLKRYADRLGFEADGYVGVTLAQLDDLAPAIVPVVFQGYPHFVVYKGRVAQQVLLADPAFGNRALEVASFEKAWQNMAFIVNRRDGRPAPNRLGPLAQDRTRATPAMIRSIVAP